IRVNTFFQVFCNYFFSHRSKLYSATVLSDYLFETFLKNSLVVIKYFDLVAVEDYIIRGF
ncbi:MAG: hypothetical protein AAFR83_25720, partial [Cyanobacteria bacterium J06629_18]